MVDASGFIFLGGRAPAMFAYSDGKIPNLFGGARGDIYVPFFVVWFSCQRLNCGGVLSRRKNCSEDKKKTRRDSERWFHARKQWLVRVNSIWIVDSMPPFVSH